MNLFADLPSDLPEELVETLAENNHVHIERTVSTGHATPASRRLATATTSPLFAASHPAPSARTSQFARQDST